MVVNYDCTIVARTNTRIRVRSINGVFGRRWPFKFKMPCAGAAVVYKPRTVLINSVNKPQTNIFARI